MARREKKRRETLRAPPSERTTTLLNAYEVVSPASLSVPVRTYVIEARNGGTSSHSKRGELKGIVWDYWREHRSCCSGRNFFVLDIDECRVAVPIGWDLPGSEEFRGYRISEESSFAATLSDPEHHPIIVGVVREAVKRRFRDHVDPVLGPLWRRFGHYCQMPSETTRSDYSFCRRFIVQPRVLADRRLIVQIEIRTTCLDGRTLDSYFREGRVRELAAMIRASRGNRTTRKGEPTSIHVWHDLRNDGLVDAEQLELDDPDALLEKAKLTESEQRRLASGTICCRVFKQEPKETPLDRVRLVLSDDVTSVEHRETILDPGTRGTLEAAVRDFLDGTPLLDQSLHLSAERLTRDSFRSFDVVPPRIVVKGNAWGERRVIEPPHGLSYRGLRERTRRRSVAIERHGFLHQTPIHPLLAWPKKRPVAAGKRMVKDLNWILKRRGIDYQFGFCAYADAEDLKRAVKKGNYTAVLAVLPEHSGISGRLDDTHEEIKRRLDVPSQCIHHDNTLPERLVCQKPSAVAGADRTALKRTRQRYQLSLDNLFLKHGWIPFEPAERFNFNVHVGIDVGGRNNDRVVACIGHGFGSLEQPITVHTQEIPVDVGQAEPIPTQSLRAGLRRMFDAVLTEAAEAGSRIDLETVLFLRDGALLGKGKRWNELDALRELHQELLDADLISPSSCWAVAEIHKRAEFWRLYDREDGMIMNPLVGRCLIGFGRENEALLCTTGRPYLTQGTAQPLKVVTTAIHGSPTVEEIIRDVAWESDMGFSKPDMGRGLPWVLHVADVGALNASRAYRLLGVGG